MTCKIFAIIFCFLIFFPEKVFAWGEGHHDNARFLLGALPKEISDFLPEAQKKLIEGKWCKYPDGHKVPTEVSTLIGQAAETEMKKYHIARYKLHGSAGQAVSFIMLTRAFREKNSQRAAFWIGVLAHTTADESAFNHGPLVHYMTYARYKHVKYPKSPLAGLSSVNRYPELMKMIQDKLKGCKPELIADAPEKALLKIMTGGLKYNLAMTSLEAQLVDGMEAKADSEKRKKAFQAMADIAVLQVEETVDAIYTAWVFARENKIPELTKQVFAEFGKEKKKSWKIVRCRGIPFMTACLTKARERSRLALFLNVQRE